MLKEVFRTERKYQIETWIYKKRTKNTRNGNSMVNECFYIDFLINNNSLKDNSLFKQNNT